MTQYTLHITLILQTLAGGQYLGELLGFPEFSSWGANDGALERNLRDTAKALAESGRARDLYQRQTTGTPMMKELTLEMEPPKSNEAWRKPVRLTLHAVCQNRPDGVRVAYVLALQIGVVAGSQRELEERLTREVRFALQRTRKAGALADLALLQQTETVELRPSELTLTLKGPKALAQEAEAGEKETKSVLEEVATELCRDARADHNTPAAYEVEPLLERMVEALTGDEARSVLLVGSSGVGKTAAVYELVRQRARRQLGESAFWATSGARLIAGAMGFGMWQERCQKLVQEAAKRRAILYLGNLVELLEVGKSSVSNLGIAGFLRPAMARGQLLAICECTVEQLALLERQDPHLLAAFRQVPVEEPPAEKVRRILASVAGEYPAPVKAEALTTLELLQRRFGAYSPFPGRAVRFLRNLLHKRPREQAVEARDVMAAFAEETGLPRFMVDDEVPLNLEGAQAWFSRRLISQDAAVDLIVGVLAAVKAGLSRPKRPIASLMFIGPTGVGKTEMAKALAEYFFSNRARLTRFDMSEYGTPAAVSRLIGNAVQEEGLLTAAVRQQPFSVILLDEVEKADSTLFDLLLQVFGEGRLTDAAGRLADFSNSIVIMTSNLGAESFGQEPFGLARGSIRDAAEHFTEEVRAFLRPEVFNRIDRIIPFLPLDPKAIRSIADRELELIRRRDGIALRGLDLRVTPEALESLAQGGYDARYGARPLKRTLERELLAPLAEAVNGHGVDVPLEASVECAADAKTGAKVVVRVRAKGTLERREMQEISPQQRVLNLRRVVQQLGRCAAVTSMHNDIFQLERQIERAEARQRNLPEMAEWRERLKRLGAPAQELKDLQAQVAEMEDTILANFYGGPAGSWPAVMLLGNAELKFTTLQKTVYGLRFADPDHIVLGLFAEDRQRLFELARIYHQLARQRTWKVEAAWFARDKRGLLRHREEAEACLATVKPEAIGLALGIDGPEALPWFEGEGGGHLFAGRQNKATCVVTMSTVPLVDMEPPEAAGRAGGLPPVAVRREYDLEKSLIRDKALDLETRWTDLGMAVGNLMDERLKRAIWEMLNE